MKNVFSVSVFMLLGVILMLTGACSGVDRPGAQSDNKGSEQTAPAAFNDTGRGRIPDAWFPRKRTGPNGTIVFYAPQIDSWKGFDRIDAWQAFMITPSGKSTSYYGSMHYVADTEVDLDKREVLLSGIKILYLSIPGLEKGSELFGIVKKGLTSVPVVVPLDLVLAYLPATMHIPSVTGLNPEPPEIFVSTTPALLLFVDGKPVWLPVRGTGLEFLLNTNWDVFRPKGSEKGPLYLRKERSWLSAAGLEGPWKWTDHLPDDIDKLPDNRNWNDVRQALAGSKGGIRVPDSAPPRIFYADSPAELLLFDGEPVWKPVGSTGIEYAANTEENVLRFKGAFYVLFSGRWFVSTALQGPWKLETTFPSAFLDIPQDHEKAYLRKNIPGTREAWEAALFASIPRKAVVKKDAAALAPEIVYAGEPVFKPVEGTSVEFAVNTKYQVLKYKGVFYLCHNAMWFRSASPGGPWTVAESIPAEFSKIPPSSPVYNTTFVDVEDADDDSVTCSYTPCYEGACVSYGTVVYGTGWWFPWHWFWSGLYPYPHYPYYPYYPWPPTYGHGSWYNPETGRFGEAIVAYGPYGNAGSWSVYNPETGVYARGEAVWDDDELRGRGHAFNPNTGTASYVNRYVDLEDREGWSERLTTRGDHWRYRETEWKDGKLVSSFETSRGARGEVVREKSGDVLKSSGTVERNGREVKFESSRERQGDTLVNEGSVTGERRSADFRSEWKDGKGRVDIKGSEGGTGTITRDVGNGEITGTGTFVKNGKTIETEMKRTAEGVVRKVSGGSGGSGVVVRQGDKKAFVAESGSGDIFAGRDGQVYKKTDSGWAKVENPRTVERQSRVESPVSTDRRRSGAEVSPRQRNNRADTMRLNRDYRSRARGFRRFRARSGFRGGFRGRRR
jgi:hypothetical protein